MVMSVEQIKATLHLRVEQADESFLRILYAMTEAYAREYLEEEITDEQIMAIPPSPEWKPLTEEELTARLEASSAQIEKGESITLEELEKEIREW